MFVKCYGKVISIVIEHALWGFYGKISEIGLKSDYYYNCSKTIL